MDRVILSLVVVLVLVPSVSASLLDDHPDAYAAYSLRQLSSDYEGPVLEVRRSSDNATMDVGFNASGMLDVSALRDFVGEGDGYVTTWHSQVSGQADLTQSTQSKQPQIVSSGSMVTTSRGDPALRFYADGSSGDKMTASATPVPKHDYLYAFAAESISVTQGNRAALGGWGENLWGVRYRGYATKLGNGVDWKQTPFPFPNGYDYIMVNNNGSKAKGWEGNTGAGTVHDSDLGNTGNADDLFIGGNEWNFKLTEYVALPSVSEDEAVNGVYQDAAEDLAVGPADWNKEAILPQKFNYQVELYDWLETINISDLTLPSGSIGFQYSNLTDAETANARVRLSNLGASRVLRQHPSNLVLDDGNGGGIEGSGDVRLLHTPGGGEARAWENEIAWWYQLDAPGFTNPYYNAPNVARRALVMTAVDMMMYHESHRTGGLTSTDQYGKAFHAWAYVYYHCKDILSSEMRQAFRDGMEYFLDFMIEQGPKDVNTNMDTFSVYAAAHVYAATNDSALKTKAVKAAKKVLLGNRGASVGGPRHDPKAGAYYPAGYVGENDNPETFYNSESYYQIVGAYNVVSGSEDWSWLKTVVDQMSAFRVYQHFPEPTGDYLGPSAYSGRTSTAMIAGQNSESWRDLTAAYYSDEAKPLIREAKGGGSYLLSRMGEKLWGRQQHVKEVDENKIGNTWTGTPPRWNGWESWVKDVPFLPNDSWYSTLDMLHRTDDPLVIRPYDKDAHINRLWGNGSSAPLKPKFWSYKTDASNPGGEWGMFVEAIQWHGPYDTVSGGSLQYFWTRDTGALIRMARGRAGKDEDNGWANIENWAVHHVWGRGANGGQFSSGMLAGQDEDISFDAKTATHGIDESPPYVEVENEFNHPSLSNNRDGQSDKEALSGTVTATNRFEALTRGVEVTQTLTSDQTDNVTELWATLPIFHQDNRYSRGQRDVDDTIIEYWDGSQWIEVPEDADSDGTPEFVTTSALRLGRSLPSEVEYGYVSFASNQTVRRSEEQWITEEGNPTAEHIRSIHIDLHGDPGEVKALPAEKSVSYTIQTTDPTGKGAGGNDTVNVSGFADPISGFEVSDSGVSVSDDVVYDTGYYYNGGEWNNVSLSAGRRSGSWLVGSASADLPASAEYVAVYSCSWREEWVCHDAWQVAELP